MKNIGVVALTYGKHVRVWSVAALLSATVVWPKFQMLRASEDSLDARPQIARGQNAERYEGPSAQWPNLPPLTRPAENFRPELVYAQTDDLSGSNAPPRSFGLSLDAPGVSAYRPTLSDLGPTLPEDVGARLGINLNGVRETLAAYTAGDWAGGDRLALEAAPSASAALEWAAIRLNPNQSYQRIARFLSNNPDWPGRDQMQRAAEERIWRSKIGPDEALSFLANHAPVSFYGKLALARARKTSGDALGATQLVRESWRSDAMPAGVQDQVLKEFGEYLRPEDHKGRADLLFYREDLAAGMRAAALAGKDALALGAIRAASIREADSEKTFANAPPTVASDPAFLFAKIQYLRRAKKIPEAAELMRNAPRDASQIVDGDQWWHERRILARKLLDLGDAPLAYKLVADHGAQTNEFQVEAEFHAGWIALRALNDGETAARHFDKAIEYARTPISRARANYWRGRAAEALGRSPEEFYAKAGEESATYYGQIARLRLGRTDLPARRPESAAQGDARAPVVRAIEIFYAANAKSLATPLAYAAAKGLDDPRQLAALAQVVVRDRDAKVALNVGKFASQRGFYMDEVAFPTYGVPNFSPAANSAPLEVVYAIARQESAFDPKALSSAGAMGLMQMIAATARRTAERVGTAFEQNRMLEDPAFNAKLGAAHLGDLLAEYNNSLILTFAAYNAGGRRVKEWIAAHGDPRDPRIDPIDWVEQIPFTETRNYVQRVMENLSVYRARLGADPQGHLASDLLRREARL